MKANSLNFSRKGPKGLQCPLYNVQSGNPDPALYQTGPVSKAPPIRGTRTSGF